MAVGRTNAGGASASGSITITPNVAAQEVDVKTYAEADVNPIYEDCTTVAALEAKLTSGNIGNMYRYTGTTGSGYYNGGLYIVEPPDYLCFIANTAGSTITLHKVGSPSWTGSYSTDGSIWTEYVPSTTGAITLTNIGDKVYFKGTYATDNDYNNYLQFSTTGSIAASGNIMSLCSGDNFESVTVIPYEYMFYGLFNNCTSLTTAPTLPATTLSSSCYESMFHGCTSLTTAPTLPATTLSGSCYVSMFSGCTGLTTAPELPATTLAGSCYWYMFYGCTSLTTAPNLPATTLSGYCYASMFSGCTGLTTAPELPATTLANGCYWYMFYGCTSLTTAPNLPATTLSSSCYESMFHGCTSLYVSDTSGTGYDKEWKIPSSGTASGNYTYTYMFTNCLGTRSTDSPNFNGIQKTYYTQNTPV